MAGSSAGREAGPGDLGGDSLGAAFPFLQGCCGRSLQCRSQPAGWVLAGRGSATPRSWRVHSPLGPAVPLAVLKNHRFPDSRQHHPWRFARLLCSNAEEKRVLWFICLSSALYRCCDTKPDLIYMELTALVPLNYKGRQVSIKRLNRYL